MIGGATYPATGGPQASFGLKDWVAVDLGGNVNAVDGKWGMAYAGPRFTLAQARTRRIRIAGDLELGAGIGVGGCNGCKNDGSQRDGISWPDRLAGGGYQGLGLGLHVSWFALYVRGRVEESVARNIPLTLWSSAMLGLDFTIKKLAVINLGGGYLGYQNSSERVALWFYEVGVAFYFDLKPKG